MQSSIVKSKVSAFFCNLVVFLFSISCVFPIVWLIMSSLKTQKEFDVSVLALPTKPTLDNFIQVFTISNMPRYMVNSAIITLCSVFFILLFGFLLGYFIARFRFRGNKFIYNFFLVGMLIPVHALMVPIYIIFNKVGIYDHWFTLLFSYIAFQLPVAMYLMESYIHSVPAEMEEAAMIDGASFNRTLFTIILPICKPIFITVAIITAFYCWNEFSFALVLTGNAALRTVPLGLALFNGSYTTNYPVLMSAMCIAIAPALILYTIFSKNIINGMIAGAVKG